MLRDQPSIFWAGIQAGKSIICSALSTSLHRTPQIVIGEHFEAFSGFAVDHHDHAHPNELPLGIGDEHDGMWNRITPFSIVFIDDIFNIAGGEQLYNRILERTPRVIAMGREGRYQWRSNYLTHYVGPYASWELNSYLDEATLRRGVPNTKEARERFNRDCAAANKAWWTK